jgi:hypothetical protein
VRVVGGSRGKTSPPQTPVGADVPRRGAAPRLAPTVHRRVSAGLTLPRRSTACGELLSSGNLHWNWLPNPLVLVTENMAQRTEQLAIRQMQQEAMAVSQRELSDVCLRSPTLPRAVLDMHPFIVGRVRRP